MRHLETYKIFESLVDKKIQLLKDLAIELQDAGLQVEVINGSHSHLLRDPRVSIHTGSRYTNDYKKFIVMKVTDDDNKFNADLYFTDTIQDFIETLKSYGMNPRGMSGGNHFTVFKFDKHGSMTNSPIVRESKIFEAKKSLVDDYLSKIDATRQDVIDVFQGIIDLGFNPKFKLSYIDKNGRAKEEKTSGQETPLLTIKFESSREKYIGGSVRFDNLDYLENLYHSLAMFMSMYKDKCNIEYDLDNMIELKLRLQFDTEYDENKLSISRDDVYDALESALQIIPQDYSNSLRSDYRTISLDIEPTDDVTEELAKELESSKDKKEVDNSTEVNKIAKDVVNEVAKIMSVNLKKDIKYESKYRAKSGLYCGEQLLCNVSIDESDDSKKYSYHVKRGFLRTDKCYIKIAPIRIEIQLA
jgi:hypothetical protein